MNRPKRQHYVWRHHLRAWTDNKEKIWCLRNGKIFNPNITGIAQEKYFYRIFDLSKEQLKFLDDYINLITQDSSFNWHRQMVVMFQTLYIIKSGIDPNHPKFSEAADIIDDYAKFANEQYHSFIEGSGIETLNNFRKQDLSFLDDEQKSTEFFYFLCTQYVRTKKMKQNTLHTLMDRFSADFLEGIWPIMVHLTAHQLGLSMFTRRFELKYQFLVNNSSTNFITGDQPIINLDSTNLTPDEAPTSLTFYFPISPSLAILITEKDLDRNARVRDVSSEDAHAYNQSIFNHSYEQIYAKEEHELSIFNT